MYKTLKLMLDAGITTVAEDTSSSDIMLRKHSVVLGVITSSNAILINPVVDAGTYERIKSTFEPEGYSVKLNDKTIGPIVYR